MAIILTSFLHTHYRDEVGIRHPTKIEDVNLILTNIKNNLKSTNKIVVVANDQYDFNDNELKGKVVFDGFKKSGLDFKQKIVLDERNKQKANDILVDADLIILSGGKCFRQINFLNEIGFADFLKNYDGLVIGVSAGSMNLCSEVANFPEEFEDLGDPRWLNGLCFCDDIMIPHFDGKTVSYQFDVPLNVARNYVLPASIGKTFVGLDNDAYILIDNQGNKKYYGNICHISDSKIVYDIDVECDEERADEQLFAEKMYEVTSGDIKASNDIQDYDLNPEELLQDLYSELNVEKPEKKKKATTKKPKSAKAVKPIKTTKTAKVSKSAKTVKNKKEAKKSR